MPTTDMIVCQLVNFHEYKTLIYRCVYYKYVDFSITALIFTLINLLIFFSKKKKKKLTYIMLPGVGK